MACLFACKVGMGLLLLPHLTLAVVESGAESTEPEKGPHSGRMLRDGDFALELAIFETGVPPEFRVWFSDDGKAVSPEQVALNVKLTRLGGVVDDINFRPEGGYLRGDTVIYEPHSFLVTAQADYKGKAYRWEYDNFEGRTLIEQDVANAMKIETEAAGAATLHKTIEVFGTLILPADAKRQIKARFDGEIRQMHVKLGDLVEKGDPLVSIESNESLKVYQIKAPMTGVVSEQHAATGEQASGGTLLEITNTNTLLAELAVYPMDLGQIKIGLPVTLSVIGLSQPVTSKIASARTQAREDQAKLFRASIDNSDGRLSEGLFVSGLIEVDSIAVPLAVKRSGLQSFRDFTVVYAKFDNQYEVRMLELGREAGEWVEVLGGLSPGTRYVSKNSYIIKADIEKSGASHDH